MPGGRDEHSQVGETGAESNLAALLFEHRVSTAKFQSAPVLFGQSDALACASTLPAKPRGVVERFVPFKILTILCYELRSCSRPYLLGCSTKSTAKMAIFLGSFSRVGEN